VGMADLNPYQLAAYKAQQVVAGLMES
jgi:hypothetical protein